MKRRIKGGRQRLRRERLLRGQAASTVDLQSVLTGYTAQPQPEHPMRAGLVFRPRSAFRIPVVAALVVWCVIGGIILGTDLLSSLEVPGDTYGTVALFILVFLGLVFHYHHFAIVVDLSGVTVLGAASFRSFLWKDIIRVEGENSFFPGAQVYIRGGDHFGFSGLVFSEHQELLTLIQLYTGSR